MGAVTVAIVKRSQAGLVPAGRCVIADVTFSSSYGAGGDTFTPSQFGLSTVNAIVDCGAAVGSTTTGYVVAPDYANSKLRLLSMGAVASTVTPLAETTTAGQTGTVQRLLVYGDNPHI